MGCWNETCGISNLSIFAGDKVRLIIIEKSPLGDNYGGGYCYINDIWQPRFLPIKGKYDDYGTIEEVEGNLNTKIIEHDLKAKLIEREIDPYEKPIKKDAATLANLLQWIERGYLLINKGIFGAIKPVSIGQMLVLEDVYQYVVKAGDKQQFRSEEDLSGLLGPVDRYGSIESANLIYNEALDTMGVKRKRNRFWIMDMDKTDPGEDDPRILPLREQSVEFFKFMRGMSRLRKPFAPQTGKGGQDDSGDAILGLNKVTTKIINKREEDWKREFGEEED